METCTNSVLVAGYAGFLEVHVHVPYTTRRPEVLCNRHGRRSAPETGPRGSRHLESRHDVDDAIYDLKLSFAVLSDRISAAHQEFQERLEAHAIETGVWLEEEAPKSFLARQADRPGECEIVTARTCTCRRYRVWHRCEHVELVRRILDERGQS